MATARGEMLRGATLGLALGAASGLAAYVLSQRLKKVTTPTKQTNPREWSIWCKIDRKRAGYVHRKDIKNLCYRMGSDEHAEVLAQVMDPDGLDMISFETFISKFKYVKMMRQAARLKLWHRTCGIGVAGNVAGHMAQAGEASKDAKPQTMPAALFTYYMPPLAHHVSEHLAAKHRLEHFPVTYAVIDFPRLPGAMKVQVEPELGLYVDIVYAEDKSKVERLMPRRVAAFNDCSIRVLEGADKLSMKKNWGFGSKGISLRSFEIDSFSKGSFVDSLVIISYLKRAGQTMQYSIAAPCRNYLCFHEPLLDWIVKSINEQQNTDKWEEIWPTMKAHEFPSSAWIACGAGEYTEWGATNYIEPGDEAVIIIYDERVYPSGPSTQIVENSFEDKPAPEGLIDLHQTFVCS